MKSNIKKVISVIIIFLFILTSCNRNSHDNIQIPLNTEKVTKSYSNDEVVIYLPKEDKNVDYETWSDFFNHKFNTNVVIDSYAGMKLHERRAGIYLFSLSNYQSYYQFTINAYEDGWIKGKSLLEHIESVLGSSFNSTDITKHFNQDILAPYSDKYGNVWGIPYEYRYPELRIRKYNKDIMQDRETPTTIHQLYELLKDVKVNSKINYVLPSMESGAVFSNFEDIVNAFDIVTNPDSKEFYSIQYDPEKDEYIDIALEDKMKECIEYFKMLIHDGIITLDGEIHQSNNNFYNDYIFSVYETIDREEDLTIPYTTKLYTDEYEPHLYYIPTRYVYVLGENTNVKATDKVLDTIYFNDEASLMARYGIQNDNYSIIDNDIIISKEKLDKAPKLIGEFPDDIHKLLQDKKLTAFKNKITNSHIESGYYRELNAKMSVLDTYFDRTFLDRGDNIRQKDNVYSFANLFYYMLSEYFFNENRPSTDDFIYEYSMEMRRRTGSKTIKHYFSSPGTVISMEFKY